MAYGLLFATHQLPVPAPATTAAFITGTSTGIGRHAALTLACEGYLVFAGVRRDADGESLAAEAAARGCASNLVSVLVDVSVHAQVVAAAGSVSVVLAATQATLKPRTLGLVITNAGVMHMGSVEGVPMEDVRKMFDVNVLGVVEVAKAFLPLLRAHGRGARFINMGSVASWTSSAIHAVYSGTKHAVRAIMDGMRIEMLPFGIAVVSIEPGFVDTPLLSKALVSSAGDLPADVSSAYAHMAQGHARYQDIVMNLLHANAGVEDTSAAVLRAATSPMPANRYLVGVDAYIIKLLASTLPEAVADLLQRVVLWV